MVKTEDSALTETVAKLREKLEALRAQVRQAQQLSVLGRHAATLAHEVNNLLTPLLGYVEAALTSQDAGMVQKALEVTLRNGKILVGMSERVLEIGAARPGKRERVLVRSVIDAALASLCRDLSKDGIKLLVSCGDEVSATCDALQLQQVLFNLFLNAREAMSESHGGVLKVTGWVERGSTGSRTVLEVRNSGVRIAEEMVAHLFEPFQSSKSANRGGRVRCGGLGLALCKELIEENGGTIEALSEETGTTFRMTLPPG